MSQESQAKMGQGKQVRLRRIGPVTRAVSEPPKGILRNSVTSTPKPVTLRRPKGDLGIVTKTKKIQENLKTLEKNTEKKRIAQAIYYGETGQSPLTRPAVTRNEQMKKPVHTRLGKMVRLHRFPLNYNNRIIKSKNRFQRQNAGLRRLFSVQARLQRIREQQSLQRQNAVVGGQQVVPTRTPNKIRLQRTRPIAPLKPTNLTVQVNNNKNSLMFDGNSSGVQKHSPLGCLNPKLQAEIKFLQRSCGATVPLNIASEPIFVEGVGHTGVSLHERFSML